MIIEINHLSKRYEKNGKFALEDISYASNNTEPLGIVGSNGAGKSTLFLIANGLAKPTGGDVLLYGQSIFKDRRLNRVTGLFTDRLVLYPVLTVKETIRYFMGIYGVRIAEYESFVRMFHIKEFENSRIEELSTGMLKKVMLLISILNHPRILFLDEPFSGLDIDAKNELSEAIKSLYQNHGVKVIISSHDLFETQSIIQDVMFIEEGKIIESGKFDVLIQKYTKTKYLKVICKEDSNILKCYGEKVSRVENGNIIVGIEMNELYSFLSNINKNKIINIINNDMSLEDVYEEARKHAVGSNVAKRDTNFI